MQRNNFFTKLYQYCEGQIEVRPLPGQPAFFDTDDFEGIDAHCKKFELSNLYFGVGTRNGNGGKKENVVNIPCVWADIDFKTTPRDIAKDKLSRFPFKPSVIVSSGGGVHLYWLLKEPAEPSDFDAIEDINKRIANLLGGDDVFDTPRILRIPGTYNRKPEYKPSPLCKVLRLDDFYYSLEDFLEILPKPHVEKKPVEGVKEDNWLASVMCGVSENRNTTGTKIAGYFINKLSPAETLTILKSWNHLNKPPLENKEIETIAKSVSRYQPDIATKHKVDMANVYDSARMIEVYKEYIKTLKQNRFITGINEIDRRIRGVAGGEVLTIIARSGSFKTATLQNLLKNYIDHSAWGAVFFSIEMPVATLTERYLQILDGCTGKEVENLFAGKEQDDIRATTERSFSNELKKLFVIPTRVSLNDIGEYIQLIERERNIKIGVIGIDYMGLMDGPGVNEYEIVSRLSTGLKSTAKLLNVPVIVLAQVSRKGASGETEISLDMGRGSGAIEEAADFVLGLWQHSVGEERELICKILKNRKGPAGDCWRLDLTPHALYIGPDATRWTPSKKECAEFK